jgi:hypothetical protein
MSQDLKFTAPHKNVSNTVLMLPRLFPSAHLFSYSTIIYAKKQLLSPHGRITPNSHPTHSQPTNLILLRPLPLPLQLLQLSRRPRQSHLLMDCNIPHNALMLTYHLQRLLNPQNRHLHPPTIHILLHDKHALVGTGNPFFVLESIELVFERGGPFLVVAFDVVEVFLEAGVLMGGESAVDLGVFDTAARDGDVGGDG